MKTKKSRKSPIGTTFVNFVLDMTGSMSTVWRATMSGFNEYLSKLKADTKSNYRFTLSVFNSETGVSVRHAAVPLGDVAELNDKNYTPLGMTPLYDAVARTIRYTEGKIRETKPEPAVLTVVMTDGEENASREHTLAAVRALVEAKQKEGWVFLFLGANMDSWAVAHSIGVAAVGQTLSYPSTPQGVGQSIGAAAIATVNYSHSTGGLRPQHTAAYSGLLKDAEEEEKKKRKGTTPNG